VSLVEYARALTAKAKEHRQEVSQARVRRAWSDILQAIWTRAEGGDHSVLICEGQLPTMKGWNDDDRDCLAQRLRDHEFESRNTEDCVYIYWRKK